jgi:hypothetical protein
MTENQQARWRDGLFCELGEIKRGLRDLGKNFDDWRKQFDGNGQPGRCALEIQARDALAERVRTLEDERERKAWTSALWKVAEAAASVIVAAIIIGLLHHFLHWL